MPVFAPNGACHYLGLRASIYSLCVLTFKKLKVTGTCRYLMIFAFHSIIHLTTKTQTKINIHPIFMESLPGHFTYSIHILWKILNIRLKISNGITDTFYKLNSEWLKKKEILLFIISRQPNSPSAQAASTLSLLRVLWASCNFRELNNNLGVNETRDCQRFIIYKQGAIEALKEQTPSSCWKVILWDWFEVDWIIILTSV